MKWMRDRLTRCPPRCWRGPSSGGSWMRTRVSSLIRLTRLTRVAVVAALAFVLPVLRPQPAPHADAEFLRKGYDTYRVMLQSSPYRTVPWQYLGPTNVSGRA